MLQRILRSREQFGEQLQNSMAMQLNSSTGKTQKGKLNTQSLNATISRTV